MIEKITTHPKFQTSLTVWVFVLLFNGQGFRNLIGLIAYGIICLITVTLTLYTFRQAWHKQKHTPILLILFLIITGMTTLWSATPWLTTLANLILFATTLTSIIIAKQHTLQKIFLHLHAALIITIAGGLLFELIISIIIQGPAYPLHLEFVHLAGVNETAGVVQWSNNNLFTGGPIQGFIGNRNLYGFTALLLCITAVINRLEKTITTTNAAVSLCIAVAVQLLTISATVTIGFFAAGILLLAGLLLRVTPVMLQRYIAAGLGIAATVTAVFALKYSDQLFAFFDREPNLTNRTLIWEQVIQLALQRPEGWGWVSYWPVWTEPYKNIIQLDGVPVSHAHNAYLDVWFQAGIIGVAALIAITLQLLASNWRVLEHSTTKSSYLPLGLFLIASILILQALTESRLLLEGNWALLVITLMFTPPLFKKARMKKVMPITTS